MHLMCAQAFARELRCPGALSREGTGAGGGWEEWDSVAFECVCVVLLFVCRVVSGQGSSSSPGRCLFQPGG